MSAEKVYERFLCDLFEMAKGDYNAAGIQQPSFDAFTAKGSKAGPEVGLDFCDENYQPRKERPVADKMASMKSTYTLIKDHDRGSLVGSTGQAPWFDRDDKDRAKLLKKNNKVGISESCFKILDLIHENDPSVNPIASGFSIGSTASNGAELAALDSSGEEGNSAGTNYQVRKRGAPENAPFEAKKQKIETLRDVMGGVMDSAFAKLQEMADAETKAIQEENEKNRQLLRELFRLM